MLEMKHKSKDRSSAVVKRAARHIRLVGFIDYRRYLLNIYYFVKKELDSYSYIQFSIDLGLGKSNASTLIIKEKRNLSDKHARDVLAKLGLRGFQANYFEAMVKYSNARSLSARDEIFLELMQCKSRIEPRSLDAAQISFYGSWLNPVIKELSHQPEFIGEAGWIQDRLRFPVRKDEVKRALELLEELGYLVFDAKKKTYEVRHDHPPGLKLDSLSAIRYHQAMINAGRESLTRVPGDQREASGCTASLSSATFDAFCEKFRKLVDEVEEADEQGKQEKGSEVYQVNFQLFPFTKINS